MPTIPSSPASFTISVAVGQSTNFQSVTFAIPAGNWRSGTWQTTGNVTSGHLPIQWADVDGGLSDNIYPDGTSGSYTGTGSVSPINLGIINAHAGGTLNVHLRDQRGVPPDVTLVDNVSSFVLILDDGSSSSSAAGRSSSSVSAGSSGSSGGECIQSGATGSIPISYDSVDPIYADSAGYWVVFDDTVKVIADIDTPSGWSMNFDDPSNPSTAFVGVALEAMSGNYFINYYFPMPTSSGSSSSLAPVSSSSSSGTSGDANVALFVSKFCVSGGSGSSDSLASDSSSSLSSESSASSLASASSSSGGAAPCNAYKDDYFNVPYDPNYLYKADTVTFHGTNNVKTPKSIQGLDGNYRLTVTPTQPLGVCIPSTGSFCMNHPKTSWTNFQNVLDYYITQDPKYFGFPHWEFHYVGQMNPLPDGSLRCHTYEALLGEDIGYTAGQLLRAGVRFHLEYCPGPTPPIGTPVENLHWIQVMYSSDESGSSACLEFVKEPIPQNRTDAGGPYFENEDSVGTSVINPCESKDSVKMKLTGVFLVDHPQTTERSKTTEGKIASFPRIFRAETFLCQEIGTNAQGGKIVNVYNGVQWGFQVIRL